MQGGNAEAELHIFGRTGRAEVRNVTRTTSWVVKAERRCGSELHIIGSQCSVEA